MLTAAMLVGCAPEMVADWQPPTARHTAEIRIVSGPPGVASSFQQPGHHEQFENTYAAGATHTDELGLMPHRLRNDTVGVAARFVYVPGADAFNARVNDLLWNAIRLNTETHFENQGTNYTPQVHADAAQLGDRGCVAGSTTWPATDVLTRPETGTRGGESTRPGTAVTCEILNAFGDTLVIAFRTVSGSADTADQPTTASSSASIETDSVITIVLDMRTGEFESGADRWNEAAAAELWQYTAELVRRQAGAISLAPIDDAPPEQVQLTASALNSARYEHAPAAVQSWGTSSSESEASAAASVLRVRIAEGLFATEFAGLGLSPTSGALELQASMSLADRWASDAWRERLRTFDEPFRPPHVLAATVPIDCALLPCVALTYDDGPSEYTPQLLDALAAEHARATFYMLGGYAQRLPETVVRVASEGHEIGSHSMWHPDLTELEVEEARESVLQAAAVLEQISGQRVATFRPPYGAINTEVIEAIGLPAVNWTIDPEDWKLPGAQALYERVVDTARPGAIILLHDVHAATVDASPDLIRGLHDRGFVLVTVTELFNGELPVGLVRGR